METITWPDASGSPPVSHTIAHYKRERPEVHPTGHLIAVSAAFTSYAIRGGLIRAIHRKSEATTLCRGLAGDVADMRFCRGHDLLAAASGANGRAVVWRLKFDEAANAVEAEIVLTTPDSAAPAGGACLALFRSESLLISSLGGPDIQVWSIPGSGAEPVSAPIATVVAASGQGGVVRALAVAPSGGALLAGLSSGEGQAFAFDGESPSSALTALPPFAMHASAVGLVAALAEGLWVSASACGGSLKVWHGARGGGDASVACVHSVAVDAPPVSLHDPALPLLLAFDPATRRLLMGLHTPSAHTLATLQVLACEGGAGGEGGVECSVGAISAVSTEYKALSLAPLPRADGGVDAYCVAATTVGCFTLGAGLLADAPPPRSRPSSSSCKPN